MPSKYIFYLFSGPAHIPESYLGDDQTPGFNGLLRELATNVNDLKLSVQLPNR